MDGLLLDTEAIYTEVTQDIVGKYGKVFDISVKKRIIGRTSNEAAKIIMKLISYSGVINLGGPAQSVYSFASKSCPDIKAISRVDVTDVNIAPDTTLDTKRLNKIINNLIKISNNKSPTT